MKNFRVNKNKEFDKGNNDILDNELFSLKITDSLYKKDIGKFLEFLSSYLIWEFILNIQFNPHKGSKHLHTKTF